MSRSKPVNRYKYGLNMANSTRTNCTEEKCCLTQKVWAHRCNQNQPVPELNPIYLEARREVLQFVLSAYTHTYFPKTMTDYKTMSEPDDMPPYTPKLGSHVLSMLQHPCAQPSDPVNKDVQPNSLLHKSTAAHHKTACCRRCCYGCSVAADETFCC